MARFCRNVASAVVLCIVGMASASTSAQVAARVGEKTISTADLLKRAIIVAYGKDKSSADSTIRRQALEDLICDEVLAAVAAERRADITDRDIREEVSRVRAVFPSTTAWNAYLKRVGMSENDFKQTIAAELLRRRVLRMLVTHAIVPEIDLK